MSDVYQWTKPCDFCSNVTEFHCNTCGDALCGTCSVIHRKSKATRHHVIVHSAEKIDPPSDKQMTCELHNGTRHQFWCEPCQEPACAHCVTSSHRGHQLNDITEVMKIRKDAINSEVNKIQQEDLEEWKSMLSKAKDMTRTYDEAMDSIDKSLLQQADDIHNVVDNVVDKRRTTLQRILRDAKNVLIHQEQTLEDGVKQVQLILLTVYKCTNLLS
ncbi:hypothetical protein FSP39_018845 [Pinctada imbricata]|uniref:B box-type domain-containing protein n=1 Tax=Pinctada imbricata TaxID=66713 RepID=A0AA88XGP0_PINIB|nr:hypothetical protein FSP39_018845 [Pinctada imbricata]